MYWQVSPIFHVINLRDNFTIEWSLTLTNTSLEKLELNTLDCCGNFENLNSKEISHLLINLKEITRVSFIFSGFLYLTHT